MPFGPDPKKPHAVCIHGAGGGSHPLPDNFPLAEFIKKSTCKKNEKTKLYDCYFEYDPVKFNERSGTYKHWEGSALLYVLFAAIVFVIAGFALLYCLCLKSGGGHVEGGGGHRVGGHSTSDKIRSGLLRSIAGKSNKSSKRSSKKSKLGGASKHRSSALKSKKSKGGKSLKKSGKK